MIQLTNHAIKRLKQRAGIPKRSAERMAALAYEKGKKHISERGKDYRYLDNIFLYNRTANSLRVHGNHIYLFFDKTLITVLNLPKNMRGGMCE